MRSHNNFKLSRAVAGYYTNTPSLPHDYTGYLPGILTSRCPLACAALAGFSSDMELEQLHIGATCHSDKNDMR